jgi:phage-related protein
MSDDRIDAIEQRLARVERELQAFQHAVAKKLAEALQLIQKHQKLRDVRMNQQLRKIVEELTSLRETMAAKVPPVMN